MNLSKTIALLTLVACFIAVACRREPDPTTPIDVLPAGTSKIAASTQRSGNAAAGYNYLTTGNYVSSGIPYNIYKQVFGNNDPQDLDRTGDNQGINYKYTVLNVANGAKVATANCLTCHAETLNGQLLVGLGNNTSDYTTNQAGAFTLLDPLVQLTYGNNSPEWEAYYPVSRSAKTIGPHILTATRGVNPADKIFAVLSAHRNANDLTWLNNPSTPIPTSVVPTDVPAFWLMKKKNAIYYNALGTGDFGRLSMASGLLTMQDSAEARQIDNHFADVMAYIRTIQPPVYPHTIDATLAAQGKTLFESNCKQCHGTYGTSETYPNLLVQASTVGTDPTLASLYATYPEYHSWFNGSWFAKDPAKAQLLPTTGYIAPPLDGIWATAPYLHNASIPTLEDLLLSSQRPTYWKRTFNNADYDQVKLGWNYTTPASKTDADTYDTTLPGYRNIGHTYGDALTPTERKSLLEYLKTL